MAQVNNATAPRNDYLNSWMLKSQAQLNQLALESQTADELRQKGNEHYRNAAYFEAAVCYTEAIKQRPDDCTLYSNRSAARAQLGMWAPSLADADKAIELDPNFAKGWSRKAAAHEQLGQWDYAVHAYSRFLECKPGDEVVLQSVSKAVMKRLEREVTERSRTLDQASITKGQNDHLNRMRRLARGVPRADAQRVGAFFASRGEDLNDFIKGSRSQEDEAVSPCVTDGDRQAEICFLEASIVSATIAPQTEAWFHYANRLVIISEALLDQGRYGGRAIDYALAALGIALGKTPSSATQSFYPLLLFKAHYAIAKACHMHPWKGVCARLAKYHTQKAVDASVNDDQKSMSLSLKAVLLAEEGCFDEAIENSQQAVDCSAAPYVRAQALCTEADVLRKYGEYGRSLERYRDALTVLAPSEGVVPSEVVVPLKMTLYSGMGMSAFAVGQYSEAVDLMKRGASLAVQHGSRGVHVSCIIALSSIYARMEAFDSALECLNECEQISYSKTTKMQVEAQRAMLKASLLSMAIPGIQERYVGLVDQIRTHLSHALEIAKSLHDKNHVVALMAAAGALPLILPVMYKQKIPAEHLSTADTILSEALSIARKSRVDRERVIPVLLYRAIPLFIDFKNTNDTTKLDEAIALLREAKELCECSLYTLKKDDQLVSFAQTFDRSSTYNLLAHALLWAGKTDEALETIDHNRSRALIEELSAKRQGHRDRVMPPMSVAEMQEYAASANVTLLVYAFACRNELYTFSTAQSYECWLIADKDDGVFHFSNVLDSQGMSEGTGTRTNCCEDIIELISPIKRSSRNAKVVSTSDRAKNRRREFSDNEARKLYAQLWKPIENKIPQDRPVVVLPQGDLFNIPFCLLLDSDGNRLVERYTISFAPSIAALKLVGELSATSTRDNSALLVVGNPTIPRGLKGLSFRRLSGAEDEANDLATMLPIPIDPLCGHEATKEVVLQKIESCRILHFASHGLLHFEQQGYIPGAILLSTSKGDCAQVEDCLLTSLEIQQHDLSGLKLAVLSCCYTGAGEITQEGLLGLGRAFMFAGCESIVVAMWAVPDAETRLLMRDFYTHFLEDKKFGAPSALRHAQLKRKKAGAPASAWGGFYVLGVGA